MMSRFLALERRPLPVLKHEPRPETIRPRLARCSAAWNALSKSSASRTSAIDFHLQGARGASKFHETRDRRDLDFIEL